MRYDVAVVGGGLIGGACADALAGEGLKVCVLDQGDFAREASWAGAGILHPIHPWKYPAALQELLRAGPALHPPCAADLLARTGIDVELERSGLVVMGDHVDRLVEWCGEEIANRRLEDGSLLIPDACHVKSHRLARAFLEGARLRGADLLPFSPATSLRPGRIETPRGVIQADLTVLCAGAWAGRLCPGLEVEPVRGQILLFSPDSGVALDHVIVFPDGEYAVPRRDGRILFGSTIEHVGFDPKPTETACEALLERAGTLLDLAPVHLEAAWAGLRPGSATNVPYLGRHPDRDDLVLACGHYRNGILLAPLTGRLVTEVVTNRYPSYELLAFRPR